MSHKNKSKVPIIKNQSYEVDIDALGSRGEGIGRVNNFAIFIPGALPGERILTKVVKVQKSFAYGIIEKIIKPSMARVKAPCPYYPRCGGCQLQHMDYESQLDFKKQVLVDALKKIGGFDNIKVENTLGMKEPWKYRNKMQFPVGLSRGELAIGPFAPRSHNIIDAESCLIQDDFSIKLSKIIREFIKKYKISIYDETKHKGLLRHIVTRINSQKSEIMLILVLSKDNLPHQDKLIHMLKDKMPNLVSLVLNINSKKTNVILGDKNIVIWGKDHIMDKIGDLDFRVSPLSFLQINHTQTEILYDKVLEFAEFNGHETVIDAYCGIGTISLYMSRHVKKIYGVEIVPDAIRDAKYNTKINKIDNAEFIEGLSEIVIPKMVKEGLEPDIIIVDPPRKGCDQKLLDSLINASPKKIIYVSCNPATLARDLKVLNEGGYDIQKVQPVDMFPQTSHVECVVLITRNI